MLFRSHSVDAGIHTEAAARATALYRRRLDIAASGDGDSAPLRKVDQIDRALRLAALAAEREAIFSLARESDISDATSRKLVREIDLVEARYR